MEEAENLVIYAGALLKGIEPQAETRQKAFLTREWLRDQGYDIPVYEKQPGF
ncbi:hypothetical protein [Streptomyces sp. NPDC058661]